MGVFQDTHKFPLPKSNSCLWLCLLSLLLFLEHRCSFFYVFPLLPSRKTWKINLGTQPNDYHTHQYSKLLLLSYHKKSAFTFLMPPQRPGQGWEGSNSASFLFPLQRAPSAAYIKICSFVFSFTLGGGVLTTACLTVHEKFVSWLVGNCSILFVLAMKTLGLWASKKVHCVFIWGIISSCRWLVWLF